MIVAELTMMMGRPDMMIGGVDAVTMLAVVRTEMQGVLALAYLASGLFCWRKLLAQADAMGEHDILFLSSLTLWGRSANGS